MRKVSLSLNIGVFIFCIFLYSCNQNKTDKIIQKEKSPIKEVDTLSKADTTVILDNGIIIQANNQDDYNSATYSTLSIIRNGNEVASFKNEFEFEFGDGFNYFPPNITTKDNISLVAIEIADKPSKNYLTIYYINDDTIESKIETPTFINTPIDFDNDGLKELAGFWEHSEVWGDSNQYTSYNPLLFYEITEDGIELDSSLTIEKNLLIYDSFYGYEFSESFEVSVKSIERLSSIIEEIQNQKE